MNPRSRAQLQVIETEQDRAVTRLHHLIRHRETLRGPFRDFWTAILAGADNAELDRWAEGALELAFVNAGPDCQFAFWRTSSDLKSELSLNELAGFAHAAADICRGAGALVRLNVVNIENGQTSAMVLRQRDEDEVSRESVTRHVPPPPKPSE